MAEQEIGPYLCPNCGANITEFIKQALDELIEELTIGGYFDDLIQEKAWVIAQEIAAERGNLRYDLD